MSRRKDRRARRMTNPAKTGVGAIIRMIYFGTGGKPVRGFIVIPPGPVPGFKPVMYDAEPIKPGDRYAESLGTVPIPEIVAEALRNSLPPKNEQPT